ncbi:MAG: DUF1989 domain-containing protein [Phycisphaerales bacterium]
MPVIERIHIPAQTGIARRVRAGQIVRVIDPQGEQVADLMAFADGQGDREWLSSGRTIDYANTIYLTRGHTLYSNRSRPMFTIVEDTVGRHDFILTPCSLEMFHKLFGVKGHHPSCHENLAINFEPFGIHADRIPTTFNIFMTVTPAPGTGELTIDPPASGPGDSIDLRAEIDLIVGVTACSSENSNNGVCKPIEVELREGAED